MKTMTTKQATEHLTRWQSTIEQWEKVHDQLCNLTGGGPESPISDAAQRIIGALTNTTAELIGARAEEMHWFRFECKFGKSKLLCIISPGHEIVVESARSFLATLTDEDGNQIYELEP
jgi:hypothetical protein